MSSEDQQENQDPTRAGARPWILDEKTALFDCCVTEKQRNRSGWDWDWIIQMTADLSGCPPRSKEEAVRMKDGLWKRKSIRFGGGDGWISADPSFPYTAGELQQHSNDQNMMQAAAGSMQAGHMHMQAGHMHMQGGGVQPGHMHMQGGGMQGGHMHMQGGGMQPGRMHMQPGHMHVEAGGMDGLELGQENLETSYSSSRSTLYGGGMHGFGVGQDRFGEQMEDTILSLGASTIANGYGHGDRSFSARQSASLAANMYRRDELRTERESMMLADALGTMKTTFGHRQERDAKMLDMALAGAMGGMSAPRPLPPQSGTASSSMGPPLSGGHGGSHYVGGGGSHYVGGGGSPYVGGGGTPVVGAATSGAPQAPLMGAWSNGTPRQRHAALMPEPQRDARRLASGSRSGTPFASRAGTPISSRHGTPVGSRHGTPVGSRHGTPVGSRPGLQYGTASSSIGGGVFGSPYVGGGGSPYVGGGGAPFVRFGGTPTSPFGGTPTSGAPQASMMGGWSNGNGTPHQRQNELMPEPLPDDDMMSPTGRRGRGRPTPLRRPPSGSMQHPGQVGGSPPVGGGGVESVFGSPMGSPIDDAPAADDATSASFTLGDTVYVDVEEKQISPR